MKVVPVASDIDEEYLVTTLVDLVSVPTDVPLGFETFIEPDHPKLVHYVQEEVRPRIEALGVREIIDAPRNNVIVRVGEPSDRPGLLIQNYTPTQHHNLMADPFRGRVGIPHEYGIDVPCVYGQGVSQNKSHQASMLAALKYLHDHELRPSRPVYWAVNNEGLSSHLSSWGILDTIDSPLAFCIIQLGTNLDVVRGNRGRVDVNVHVHGKETHSSTPEDGRSAIEGFRVVADALETLSWDDDPALGRRQAIPYKVRFEPLAPHTLPSDAFIAVDRRLLPGDDPTAATEEIRQRLTEVDGFEITVTEGYSMLPNWVDESDLELRTFLDAQNAVAGAPPELKVSAGTFDAGGPGSRGIPTVQYGASGGIWPTGDDFVSIQDVVTETRTLLTFLLSPSGRDGSGSGSALR